MLCKLRRSSIDPLLTLLLKALHAVCRRHQSDWAAVEPSLQHYRQQPILIYVVSYT